MITGISIKTRLRTLRLYMLTRYAQTWAYLAPAAISVFLFSLVPIAYSAFIAFTNFDLYHFTNYHFVGLENFKAVLTGPFASAFIPTIAWTFIFSGGSTLINYAAGMLAALLLNASGIKFKALFRTALIVPWALPSTITVLVWQGLLNKSFGAINHILMLTGLPAVPWLVDPTWAKLSIIMVNLWLGFPFFMVSLLGGLQSIPHDIVESAKIDGASTIMLFRHIILPLLWRFSVPLILGTFAYNFNNFGVVYLLTQGGPPRATTAFAGTTDVLSTQIYNMTLTFNRYDIAATLGLVLFVILAMLTLIQMKIAGGLNLLEE